ncbi:MAG TPA: NAD(P)-binding domain-containing protein [Casimicrobiaceae bacterium]
MERIETVVVGGGQAGLALSCHLSRHGCEHVVLERGRLAERWRAQRWDSLMFQFPNWSIELPGARYEGDDPDGFSHRGVVQAFIAEYALRIRAPVRVGVDALAVRRSPRDGRYVVVTANGDIEACNVVLATGPYQRPIVPDVAASLPRDLVQVHAADYRNPAQLPPGAVLLVGSGASGCQIAEELTEAGRRVFFSIGRHERVPRRYRGRDAFWWRRELGTLDQVAEATPKAMRTPPPLVTGVRGGYDVDLRRYPALGMVLTGRLVNARDGVAAFAPDLEHNLTLGDRAFVEFIRSVDGHVRRAGLDAPPAEEAAESSTESAPAVSPSTVNLRAEGIGAVIWATGYAVDFGWVELPICDARGAPLHRDGVTAAPGIYFLGLPWLRKRKSSFLGGVGEDAMLIADRIGRTGTPGARRAGSSAR